MQMLKLKKRLYLSVVKPIVMYCACAWNPWRVGKIKQIESVQRKAVRCILNNWKRDICITNSLYDLNLNTLENERNIKSLVTFYRIFHGLTILPPDVIGSPSKNSTLRHYDEQTIFLPYVKTTTKFNSFFHRCIKPWNSITNNVDKKISNSPNFNDFLMLYL